ncbi:hypothetical protein TWF730_002987 [Orbilia blumenaviensis]|uniref:Uncharacterized protein n=1 Tax=Orbilia blumenaviensis TaxID=1796055 RepID=A0AAV9U9A3_9PEZI
MESFEFPPNSLYEFALYSPTSDSLWPRGKCPMVDEDITTKPFDMALYESTETPTDTLRATLLRTLHQITNPRLPYQPIEPTSHESLRSALIIRCCFHISQGLADQPLDEISLLPPFLPDKTLGPYSALESWNSWVPLPQASPGFCDPFLLLLSPGWGILDLRIYSSHLSLGVDDIGNELDAFTHEVYARHGSQDGCGKRYYCLYDNCLYNMRPVAVSREEFGKHLKTYHGVCGVEC